MKRHRTRNLIGAGAATAALIGSGYVGLNWLRYGKTSSHDGRADPLLDHFVPEYEVREFHRTQVAARADITYSVASEIDMHFSGLIRAILRGRELLMGADPGGERPPQSFLSETSPGGTRLSAATIC
jgi:hypothetical protein